MAVDAADAVLFVVDATVGVTDADAAVASVLRRSGKPVVVAANKVDDTRAESEVAALWSLGLGEPAPVSALHGRGSGNLLDLILDALPEAPRHTDTEGGPRRVALLGRPNVGKSSLLNKLVGHQRSLVDPVASTTRDPVDELVELGGITWRFVDTAGIRRRYGKTRARTTMRRCAPRARWTWPRSPWSWSTRASRSPNKTCASSPWSSRPAGPWSSPTTSGTWSTRSAQHYLEREIDRQLHTARWAPRVNISAATGRHMDRLVPGVGDGPSRVGDPGADGPAQRLADRPGRGNPAAGPRRAPAQDLVRHPQAGVRPPHFVLFTSGFLEAGYRRFVERRLREEFGFDGSPVQVSVRVRAKREGHSGRRPAGASRRR